MSNANTKSPALARTTTRATKLTAPEAAFVELRRGRRSVSAYLADLVRADRAAYLAEQAAPDDPADPA